MDLWTERNGIIISDPLDLSLNRDFHFKHIDVQIHGNSHYFQFFNDLINRQIRLRGQVYKYFIHHIPADIFQHIAIFTYDRNTCNFLLFLPICQHDPNDLNIPRIIYLDILTDSFSPVC